MTWLSTVEFISNSYETLKSRFLQILKYKTYKTKTFAIFECELSFATS